LLGIGKVIRGGSKTILVEILIQDRDTSKLLAKGRGLFNLKA